MADSKRPLTLDDLFDFQWLQGGKLSPDGRRVAYAVTHVERSSTGEDGDAGKDPGAASGVAGTEDAAVSHAIGKPAGGDDREFCTIYVHDLDTGVTRQMTPGTSKDTNPAWSPDGSRIAFLSDRGGGSDSPGSGAGGTDIEDGAGGTVAANGDEKPKPQIYLLPVDGGEARKLTSLQQGAGPPRWSPDGTEIAFSAGIAWPQGEKPDRSKDPYRVTRNVWRFDGIGDMDLSVTNLYVASVATGESRKLSDHDGMVGSIAWSPDGGSLFYSVTMLPDRWAGFHSLHYVVDATDGRILYHIDDRPTFGGGTWLSDGKRLAFVGPESAQTPIGIHPDLWVYDLDSGSVDNRSEGMELSLDGSLSAKMPAHAQQDAGILVTADGNSAYLQVQRGGCVEICRFSLEGKRRRETLVSGSRAAYLYDLASARRDAVGGAAAVASTQDSTSHVLLYASADIVNPPDLFVAEIPAGEGGSAGNGAGPAGGGHAVGAESPAGSAAYPGAAVVFGAGERQITSLNKRLLADIALPWFRELSFTGTDGTTVQGWFVAPGEEPQTGSTPSGPLPTILWIHGGPHGAQGYQFAVDTLLLNGAGYAVIYVNHRASTGYGDAFSTAIHGDWGNLDYGDLMAGVEHAVAHGLADPDRLGCCGISGGGNLSCWIISHTDRFKAAVPQNPVTSWRSFYGVSDIGVWFSRKQLGGDPYEIPQVYDRCSPITTAHTCTTPTLLIQCESDFRCPAEQSEQFYTVLKSAGCIVEMLRQPGGSHGGSIRGALPLRKANLEAKLDWFTKYIPVG